MIGGNIYQAERRIHSFIISTASDIKKVGFYDFEVHLDGNVIKKAFHLRLRKKELPKESFLKP